MKKTYLFTLFALCLCAGAGVAQINVILNFTGTNGNKPFGSLIRANNVLYGMTNKGGANDSGCIFSVHTDGTGYADLHDFITPTGKSPEGSLVRSGKTLFGMTAFGGANNEGCLFSVDTNGNNYRVLLDFNQLLTPIGETPLGSLTLSVSGDTLYGMTESGNYYGNIFSVDTAGNGFTNLYSFSSSAGDAPTGDLILSGGLMFGMTFGGNGFAGVVFSIHTDGTHYKVLQYFTGANGAYPAGSLILSGAKLFGMTEDGGAFSGGNVFSIDTTGANYKDLMDFGTGDGTLPYGNVLLLGKTLYGLTAEGGTHTFGVIFSIDSDGTGYRILQSFDGANGETPAGSLIDSGSKLYGMTEAGGISSGVVFGYDTNNITTAVNHLSINPEKMSIYPNPNNGKFSVSLSHAELVSASQKIIVIYNVMGQQVYVETLKQLQGDNRIDLTNQPNGIYIYRVISENGTLIGTGKVIIQK